ncbi:hypothetical protein O6P37_19325 [Mycobacterium sp. CPCC 205372]|uniref:MarR family transcriptional regulator n=1 Tax=Mycobacterium hippophais TaxID=3016340 RepID=A0ABT4PWS2_9MYCO|nr:hypothetical protein [Mycobacterium hippophais]MCZ8381023.1 hypothetical protein [Mycobacterium hippophais]
MTVAPDELTGTEQAVLLVLMAECRPVPNPELKNLGPALDQSSRNRLQRRGLIEVTSGRPMVLELTDDGWATCRSLFGAAVPARPSGQGRALYTLMRALDRHFERTGLSLAEAFGPAQADDVDTRVRDSYRQLSRRPGGWVGLAALRRQLTEVPRDELDAVLLRLERQPGVRLIPEENRKALTDDDRAAALRIGNEDNHLIAIES